jgi:ATP/maltotriose-dependent transcriptional regulator MalT
MYRRVHDPGGHALCLSTLAAIALREGDTTAARRLLGESLSLRREKGSGRLVAEGLEEMAALVQTEGQPERATRLLGAAGAVRETLGTPVPPIYRADQEALVAAVRAALSKEAFAAAWQAGQVMTWEQAVAYALEEAGS